MELFAQTTVEYSYETSTISPVMWLIWLAIWVLYIVAFWKVFEKAGEAGWKSIIPFYNIWVMFEIAGRPGWWMFLMFIPFVNFVVWIILSLDMAKAFGKSPVFAIFGLWIFSFIGYMMLGFGDAKYVGASAEATSTEE